MDPQLQLNRFCYLGQSKSCTYIHARITKPHERKGQLPYVDACADIIIDLPFVIIKKALQNKLLPNRECALIALSRCTVSSHRDLTLRQLVYQSLPEICASQEDLFQFIAWHVSWHSETVTYGKGFGRGLRRALGKWYGSKSNLELANIVNVRHGLHKWTHGQLIRCGHVHMADNEKNEIMMTARWNHRDLTYELSSREGGIAAQSKGLQLAYNIALLKLSERPEEATGIIRKYKLTVDHVPIHLLYHTSIWEAILPQLNYIEIIKYLPLINYFRLLQPVTNPFAKRYTMLLFNQQLITASKIHPLLILSARLAFQKKHRYNHHIRRSIYKIKYLKRGIEVNKYVAKKLAGALNHSFTSTEKLGLRFMVTVDLRFAVLKKRCFGLAHLNCLDAYVLFCMTYLKCEQNTQLFTFGATKDEFQQINLNKSATYEQGYARIELSANDKTDQDLILPIKRAGKQKFDVFIVIMDSVARMARNGEFPTAAFEQYKNTVNKKAKYIVINLCRNKRTLNDEQPMDVLEICGLNLETPLIINAFLKNDFC